MFLAERLNHLGGCCFPGLSSLFPKPINFWKAWFDGEDLPGMPAVCICFCHPGTAFSGHLENTPLFIYPLILIYMHSTIYHYFIFSCQVTSLLSQFPLLSLPFSAWLREKATDDRHHILIQVGLLPWIPQTPSHLFLHTIPCSSLND